VFILLNFYSEDVYHSQMFDLIKRDNAIIVELKVNNNLMISSWHNSGYHENMKYVVNQSLTNEDYSLFSHMDYETFQQKRMNELGLNALYSTGLLTSACMDNYAISTHTFRELTVTSIITAGADKNGIRAGDKASFYEYNNDYNLNYGTINIFLIIDANLEPGALITSIITATEAKTSILQDLKLESQFSTNIATGTGTDGICVISNKSSDNHLENAGKHSKLGELIAKSVQDALLEALYLQTAMSNEYQKSVLSRLSRFNIYFDTFYNKVSQQIGLNEYCAKLYPFINDSDNISWISSVINLIDEAQVNLLALEEISEPIIKIVNTFLEDNYKKRIFNSVDEVLDFIVNSINHHILK